MNRFIYGEISKLLFLVIVFLTLIDPEDVAWYDILAIFWIVSYLLENFRTIHRLYRFGGTGDSKRIFKRFVLLLRGCALKTRKVSHNEIALVGLGWVSLILCLI